MDINEADDGAAPCSAPRSRGRRRWTRVVVAAGRVRPDQFDDLPDNVVLHTWVPQADLLPHVDVVVHHGGSGTILPLPTRSPVSCRNTPSADESRDQPTRRYPLVRCAGSR